MKLIKYNNHYTDPFASLENFFNEAFAGTSRYPFFADHEEYEAENSFRLDLEKDDSSYYVVAELPGVKKKDLKIELNNGVLVIEGEKKSKNKKEETSYRYSRSLRLPEDGDSNKISATLENGILTITIPVKEETKARTISIS